MCKTITTTDKSKGIKEIKVIIIMREEIQDKERMREEIQDKERMREEIQDKERMREEIQDKERIREEIQDKERIRVVTINQIMDSIKKEIQQIVLMEIQQLNLTAPQLILYKFMIIIMEIRIDIMVKMTLTIPKIPTITLTTLTTLTTTTLTLTTTTLTTLTTLIAINLNKITMLKFQEDLPIINTATMRTIAIKNNLQM